MKKCGITLVMLFASKMIFAQEQNQVMVTTGVDIYKTDMVEAFDKFQFGIEGNYFVADKLSLGLGFEWYAFANRGSSRFITVSPRLYPIGNLFVRVKPLIPLNRQDFDMGIGAGYDFKLSD